MKKDNNNNEETNAFVVKGPKGEFDVSDPLQKAQLEGYMQALTQNQGKLAHENDQLKRSQKKYDLVSGGINLDDAKNSVKKLREEGASEEDIDQFWLDFNQKSVSQASKGSEFEVFWAEYKHSRPETFDGLNPIQEDMYKDYVKKNASRIQDESDQFLFLDQLFEGQVRSKKEAEEEAAPYSTTKSHSASPQKAPGGQKVEKEDDSVGEFSKNSADLINSAFGFDD